MDNKTMTGKELVQAGLAFRIAVGILYTNQQGLLRSDANRELEVKDATFKMPDTGASEKERAKQERLLKMIDRAIEQAQRIAKAEDAVAAAQVKADDVPVKTVKKTHGLVTA